MAEEGRQTPEQPKQVQGHCPRCGPKIWADVVGHHKVHDSDDGVWWESNYRMLRCAGCRTVYFQEIYVFSEDYDYDHDPETGEAILEYNQRITYWPAPSKRQRPNWLDLAILDEGLYDLLLETYSALNVDARVLAATGARTVFDRASELQGIDPAKTFAEKLNDLVAAGKIGTAEREHLDALTDAGGAAAHRGWVPTLDQLDTIMSIAEAFIFRTFVLDHQVKTLRSEIPKKQRRNGSEGKT